MRILVTGAAGFIGARLSERLLDRGDEVIGVDNLNDYYDVTLKEARLQRLLPHAHFSFHKIDITDQAAMGAVFETAAPQRVMHLAAQAGVRYSITNPRAYVDANIVGFINILEACRYNGVEHLVYASSSSVYGANTQMPFATDSNVDHPVSMYAATKKSNELMAHVYSHLYRLPTTGLRFFTVYGPWGRPDMSLFLFARKILLGEPIDVFNHGKHRRDFTYIDDIVAGVMCCIDKIAEVDESWSSDDPKPSTSNAPYRLYNIGNNSPVELMDFIGTLERCLGLEAKKNMLPLQPGDVPETYADVAALVQDVGYRPSTPITEGIANFVSWYKDFYNIK